MSAVSDYMRKSRARAKLRPVFGFFVEFKTPAGRLGTEKLHVSHDAEHKEINKALKAWHKRKGRGYRVTEVAFAAKKPSWWRKRPQTLKKPDQVIGPKRRTYMGVEILNVGLSWYVTTPDYPKGKHHSTLAEAKKTIRKIRESCHCSTCRTFRQRRFR